ncbi:MAG: hypothetical protein IJS29_03760 [Selenomonadaceae bacterium]|nr:hypothetical protein [Selenomonadaceae bacterium]
MEKITPSLTNLIYADDFFQRVLIVESSAYIAELKAQFPAAEIFFVTADEDDVEKFSAQVKTFQLDYREERLPFDAEFFDAIIGDLTLEVVVNPQDIAAGFSTYIKQTGVWLTSFRNLRHWKILQQLMRGHYGGIVSRLYTRADFERLLYASFYKEVKFFPLIKKAPIEMLDRLLECGFENIGGDLETEFWLVRAARSMTELSLLKSMYTPELRANLSRLLHRIEYDIETEKSVKKFWELYDAAGMFTDYVASFIDEVVVHRENFYSNLKKYSARDEVEKIIGA